LVFGASCGLLLLSTFRASAQQEMTIDLHTERGEVEIRYKNRPLLLYACGETQFKPYVRELYTLRGENILRDSPPDHQHHHGLMYAVGVNGINFWEERNSPGVEKSVGMPGYSTGRSPSGLPQAVFAQSVHWLAPRARPGTNSASSALLLEQRTLTVMVDEKNQEVALVWKSAFILGDAGRVKLGGANYNGLGLRLPVSFDHVAQFQNSASLPYMGDNSQNVIVAKWTSVAGKIGDHDVMVTLFGDSANKGGDAAFFTMTDPFAYLSATQGLDNAPLEYRAGDTFELRYLLTVYSENKTREFNQSRCQRWQAERP
jgi:hypothetical protein